jgi:hypothetical protein
MHKMYVVVLALLLLPAAPALARENSVVFQCGGFHFVRFGAFDDTEIGTTAYTIRNLDTVNSVTWRRFTIRNLFGSVVHDSGPATGIPLPLNTAVGGGLDVTVVPPGAAYYLATEFLWGNGGIPGPGGQGNTLSTLVEVAARRPELLQIVSSTRERQLFTFLDPPAQGAMRARTSRDCPALR